MQHQSHPPHIMDIAHSKEKRRREWQQNSICLKRRSSKHIPSFPTLLRHTPLDFMSSTCVYSDRLAKLRALAIVSSNDVILEPYPRSRCVRQYLQGYYIFPLLPFVSRCESVSNCNHISTSSPLNHVVHSFFPGWQSSLTGNMGSTHFYLC